MKFDTEKTKLINMYILEKIAQGSKTVSADVSEAFGISTNTVHSYLRRLQEDNIITKLKRGEYKFVTENFVYSLKRADGDLDSESYAFDNCFEQHIKDLPDNVYRIWEYAFSEMINNVVDHSAAEELVLQVEQSYLYTNVFIIDNGVGIFNKIKDLVSCLLAEIVQDRGSIVGVHLLNNLCSIVGINLCEIITCVVEK